jgi:hypothetical protein
MLSHKAADPSLASSRSPSANPFRAIGNVLKQAANNNILKAALLAGVALCTPKAKANTITLPGATATVQAVVFTPTCDPNDPYCSTSSALCIQDVLAICEVENYTGSPPLSAVAIGWGTGVATAEISPFPVVSASSTGGGIVNATLTYQFEIVGPSYNSVPTTVSGTTTAYLTNGTDQTRSIAIASVQITNSALEVLDSSACITEFNDDAPCWGWGIAGSFSQNLSLTSNVVYTALISAYANAADPCEIIGGCYAVSATASADPYIQIDPAFLAANPGYSLVLSPSVGNIPTSSSTPEPTSFGLVAAGLIGAYGWSKRRQVPRIGGLLKLHCP